MSEKRTVPNTETSVLVRADTGVLTEIITLLTEVSGAEQRVTTTNLSLNPLSSAAFRLRNIPLLGLLYVFFINIFQVRSYNETYLNFFYWFL